MSSAENIKILPSDILKQVSGANIENALINLAAIGGERIPGTPEQSVRYAVSRLAFSPEDIAARKFLEAQMIEAGMSVTQEMFATIGLYEGTNPELKPVVLISHHDSVPNGGMYDGTVGVLSAIEAIRLLHINNIRLPHSVIIISFTEEESSRFSTGLGGSKGLTQGLTDAELDQVDKNGISKRVALEILGFDPQQAKIPYSLFLDPDSIFASIELHVEQNTRLADSNIDLGIVTAIAAPTRYRIKIGNPDIQPSSESTKKARNVYFDLNISGKSGHSGATSMEPGARADALAVQAEMLIHLNALQNTLQKENSDIGIYISGLNINNDASINKIPSGSHLSLKIAGSDTTKIAQITKDIRNYIKRHNKILTKEPSKFDKPPILFKKITKPDYDFFESKDVLRYFSLAAYFIKSVQSIATIHRKNNTVGTVGTFQFKNGQITMDVDLRGIDKTDRDTAAAQIDKISDILVQSGVVTNKFNVPCTKEEIIGGSGDPTTMNPILVKIAQRVIGENNISSQTLTFSPAGHDTQNVARKGIPTGMFFGIMKETGCFFS